MNTTRDIEAMVRRLSQDTFEGVAELVLDLERQVDIAQGRVVELEDEVMDLKTLLAVHEGEYR